MKNKKFFICLIVFSVLTLSICVIVFCVNYFLLKEKPSIPKIKEYPNDVIVFNNQFENYEPLVTYTGSDIINLIEIVKKSNSINPNYKIRVCLNTLEINEENLDIIKPLNNYVHMNRGYDSTGRINLIIIAEKNNR